MILIEVSLIFFHSPLPDPMMSRVFDFWQVGEEEEENDTHWQRVSIDFRICNMEICWLHVCHLKHQMSEEGVKSEKGRQDDTQLGLQQRVKEKDAGRRQRVRGRRGMREREREATKPVATCISPGIPGGESSRTSESECSGWVQRWGQREMWHHK